MLHCNGVSHWLSPYTEWSLISINSSDFFPCTWEWLLIVHGPEQISVPSGWAKLGNVFHVHICPVHYISHDRPLNSAAFMWLSPMLITLFPKNNIFVFFNEFQIIFKLKPSGMTVLIEYNCSYISWYPFRLYLSISLKKAQIMINSCKNSFHFTANEKYEQPLCTQY